MPFPEGVGVGDEEAVTAFGDAELSAELVGGGGEVFSDEVKGLFGDLSEPLFFAKIVLYYIKCAPWEVVKFFF